MDYLENLKTIKLLFPIMKKCFYYFETYLEGTYVENEAEYMELVTGCQRILTSLESDIEDKIENCEEGYDTVSLEEFTDVRESVKSSARILYYLNKCILNDVFVGSDIIEIYGMPVEYDEY